MQWDRPPFLQIVIEPAPVVSDIRAGQIDRRRVVGAHGCDILTALSWHFARPCVVATIDFQGCRE